MVRQGTSAANPRMRRSNTAVKPHCAGLTSHSSGREGMAHIAMAMRGSLHCYGREGIAHIATAREGMAHIALAVRGRLHRYGREGIAHSFSASLREGEREGGAVV